MKPTPKPKPKRKPKSKRPSPFREYIDKLPSRLRHKMIEGSWDMTR